VVGVCSLYNRSLLQNAKQNAKAKYFRRKKDLLYISQGHVKGRECARPWAVVVVQGRGKVYSRLGEEEEGLLKASVVFGSGFRV
jgi:hypothetical protein